MRSSDIYILYMNYNTTERGWQLHGLGEIKALWTVKWPLCQIFDMLNLLYLTSRSAQLRL